MKNNYGLLGKTLSHSLSPVIHDMIFKANNIQGRYVLYEAQNEEAIEAIIEKMRCGEIQGLNVTIPYKQTVIPYLDEITPKARVIGAVNCISYRNGKLIGDNTDYYGILKTLQDFSIDFKGKTMTLLGSGGAAKAVIKVAVDQGMTINLVSRNKEKANLTFKSIPKLRCMDYTELESIRKRDLLINCTPVGMSPNVSDSPVDNAFINTFTVLFDLIYNPLETLFLKASHCEEKSNGLKMLIIQAIKSEEIWQEKASLCTPRLYSDIEKHLIIILKNQ